MDNNENNLISEEKFGDNSNFISYCYKEIFDIDYLGVFWSKKTKKRIERFMYNTEYSTFLEPLNFKFYILIKDNNKKVFKHKLLKVNFSNLNRRPKHDIYFTFMEHIYVYINDELLKYVQTNYLDNYDNQRLYELRTHAEDINEEYLSWIDKLQK